MAQSVYLAQRYKHYYKQVAPLFKQQKVQAYMMVTLSLFAISFFGIFAIRPTLKTIGVLQRQIQDRNFVDQKLEDKINALILAQEEYQRAEPFVTTLYSLLPEKAEFSSLLIRLGKLTENTTATLSGIQMDPLVLLGSSGDVSASESAGPGGTEIVTIPIAFNLVYKGSYQDLTTILKTLTTMDRLITITGADFSLEVGDTQSLSVSVKSNAYYFPLTL